MSFLDKDVVIKKEKMFVEIHFHLLILEEKEQSCFCQMEWVLEKKRMRRLIETLEDLLEAGISEEFALEMIQDALLFQDKGAFSTIDAAVISLKTGILKLLKAGGMATFIRHKNSVERIMPAALPPGCRIGQQFDLKYKKLYDGDMVIMVSDGMLEFENMPEISFRMESLIGKIKTNNAQVFANELIEAVPVLEDGYDDDRTVLVAAIWEKGTQKCGINIGRE